MRCFQWFLGLIIASLPIFSRIEAVSSGPVYNAIPIHEAFVTRVIEDLTPYVISKDPPVLSSKQSL